MVFFPRAAVARRREGEIGQPKRFIQLAHHRQPTVRTELSAPEFQPHPTVEIQTINPLGARTHSVIHETCPTSLVTP